MAAKPLTSTLLTIAFFPGIASNARVIADADNLGQCNKPTKLGPDKEVPGFLVNLEKGNSCRSINHSRFWPRRGLPLCCGAPVRNET